MVYYIILAMSIRKASEKGTEWQKKDLYRKGFAGRINLNNIQKLNCQIFLEVITADRKQSESITLCPCKNVEFNRFVSSGDSINKQENTLKVAFIKSDGSKKEFELPLCM